MQHLIQRLGLVLVILTLVDVVLLPHQIQNNVPLLLGGLDIDGRVEACGILGHGGDGSGLARVQVLG